jgi:hypothetical protein
VTIDGAWFGNWIYWSLMNRLQVTLVLSLVHTHGSSLQNIVNLFQPAVFSPVVAWQRLWTAEFPLSLGFRTIPVSQLPASNNNSSQRLNLSYLTNAITHQPAVYFPALHSTGLNYTALSNWTVKVNIIPPISSSWRQAPWDPRPEIFSSEPLR